MKKKIAFFIILLIFVVTFTKIRALTWTPQTGSEQKSWQKITSSSDGKKLAAIAAFSDYIYTSNDSGVTWTQQSGSGLKNWYSISSSGDGTKLIAGSGDDGVYTSTDSGITWTQQTGVPSSGYWDAVAISDDGTKLIALNGNYHGYVYLSTDSGATWTEKSDLGARTWTNVAMTPTGSTILIADSYYSGDSIGGILISNDYGQNWTELSNAGTNQEWYGVTISNDGTKLAAVVAGGYIYTSNDSGATWVEQTSAGQKSWSGISSSGDGTKLAAVTSNEYIYTSNDSGATWTPEISAGLKYWFGVAYSRDGTLIAVAPYGGNNIYTSSDTPAPTKKTRAHFRPYTVTTRGAGILIITQNPMAMPNIPVVTHQATTTTAISTTTPVLQQSTSTPEVITGTSTKTLQSFSFKKDIKFKTEFSEDTRKLQTFLNTHGFTVSFAGAGSRGKETSYFGPLTKAALARFQASVGITPPAGYFGPKTRAYINSLK